MKTNLPTSNAAMAASTIQQRRRTAMRVGWITLLLSAFALAIVGCIFDEGPYHDGKGGGRRTEAPTSQTTQPTTPTGTTPTNPPADSSSGNPPVQDTGAGIQ